MSQVFKDFDLSSVWESDSWADKNYKEAPFTPEILAAVESELGYKLPQSFIELMAVQNGKNFGWKNGNIRLSACILPTTRQEGMPCLPWTTESVEKTESRK